MLQEAFPWNNDGFLETAVISESFLIRSRALSGRVLDCARGRGSRIALTMRHIYL